MRKTREEKAITLIALIITIVVLLILAVVAINAVTEDGIIQHASNAKTQYEEAQAEENDILSYYQEYLDAKGDMGPWKQEGDELIKEGSVDRIAIGDYVNYESGVSNYMVEDENGNKSEKGWRVLGIEYGHILLVAAENVTTCELREEDGYLNGVNILNNICKEYGKGKGAKEARTIKVEDINKITGYNPEITGNGTRARSWKDI